jgi:hypothetical protein
MRQLVILCACLLFASCQKEEMRSDVVISVTCIRCSVSVQSDEGDISDFIPGTIVYSEDGNDTIPASGRYNFNAPNGSAFSIAVSGGELERIDVTDNGRVAISSTQVAIPIVYVSGVHQ